MIAIRDEMSERTRTVWDARTLLSPFIGQMVKIEIDDGQFASVARYGIYLDVLRTGGTFLLRFRGLLAVSPAETRRIAPYRDGLRRISTLPVGVIRSLPAAFEFLRHDPATWRLSPPIVHCARCHTPGAGRFCTSCGLMIRRGRHLGDGFSLEQRALRATGAPIHDCGGALATGWLHCSKCGQGAQ